MAKSKRKRQRKRRSGGHPSRRSQAPVGAAPDIGTDQEFELALAEVARRAEEALSPDTSPERVAALVVEEFEDLPSPPGLTIRLSREGSEQRARAVAAEAQRLAPGSVTALTLAAEVAGALDHDPSRAGELLDEALDTFVDPDGIVELAQHMLACGRHLDAIGLVREALFSEPDDEDAQELYAGVLEDLQRRRDAGKKLTRAGREELETFADRGPLYALRDAMRELVEERRPELQIRLADGVREWMERLQETEDGGSDEPFEPEHNEDAERSEALLRLAIEHAWLLDEDGDEAAEVELARSPFDPEPGAGEPSAPLAVLANDPEVSPEISSAAREWLSTVTYGLWQVSDPEPAPGLWLTDLLTGVRRYASIPPEQLPGMSRWSVLLGALVSLDGIWRSTGAVILLRPSEGDAAAEWVHDATTALEDHLAGKRRRRRRRRGEPGPHGVLAALADPPDPATAALMTAVLGSLVPGIVGELRRRRADGPKLTNTEGHTLRAITAQVDVNDPAAVGRRLATHPDFRTEDAGQLSWWGRELTEIERAGMLAQIRSLEGPDEPIEETDEPQRWLRGRVDRHADGYEVSVNSEERLQALVQLLQELGAEPRIGRRSVIDPAQDMPPIRLGPSMPFGASQQAIDAWQTLWPDERVPALGDATPRAAARRQQSRTRLEAVLREFEHDAHALAAAGRPAPDLERLRLELGMEQWWED
jgi:hypothetical protein